MKTSLVKVLNNALGCTVRQGLWGGVVITAKFSNNNSKAILLPRSVLKKVVDSEDQRGIQGKIPLRVRIRALGSGFKIKRTGAVVFHKEEARIFFPWWSGNTSDMVVVGTDELCRVLSRY